MPPEKPEKPLTAADLVIQLVQDQRLRDERLDRMEHHLAQLTPVALRALEAEAERHKAETEHTRAEIGRLRRPSVLERLIDRVAGDTRTLLISVGVAAAVTLAALGWSRSDILAALSTILSSCSGVAP